MHMKSVFYLFVFTPFLLFSQSNWQQNADYEMSVDVNVKGTNIHLATRLKGIKI